jgi:hypothetical protein
MPPSGGRKRKICPVQEVDNAGKPAVHIEPAPKSVKVMKSAVDADDCPSKHAASTVGTTPMSEGVSNGRLQQQFLRAVALASASVGRAAETGVACKSGCAFPIARAAGATPTPRGQTQTEQAREPDAGISQGTGKHRMKLRSSGKWLQACMHVVGAATAQWHSHTISQERNGSTAQSAHSYTCNWQDGVAEVSRSLENTQGSQSCYLSLLRLASTLLRIDSAITRRLCASRTGAASKSENERQAVAGGVTRSVSFRRPEAVVKVEHGTTEPSPINCTTGAAADGPVVPEAAVKVEHCITEPRAMNGTAAAAADGASAAAAATEVMRTQLEQSVGANKTASRRAAAASSACAAHLQPAATVSVLASCTSADMMSGVARNPMSSSQLSASCIDARQNGAGSSVAAAAEGVLLHLGLVFAPADTADAAAAASCMHLLAFARRYAGIGYPAGTGYMPAWAVEPCLVALPKCMHDSMRIARSLVRSRLSSANDSPTPDVRPLWVLCELMRRCSESTADIVVQRSSAGPMITELEAKGASNTEALHASEQPIQELLLCIVCLAATHGGLTILDAEEALCSSKTSSGNDATTGAGAATSDGTRCAVTCLSAAAAGPQPPVDTRGAGFGGGSVPHTHASHANLVRAVLYLCRSHLEHLLWSLAVRFFASC